VRGLELHIIRIAVFLIHNTYCLTLDFDCISIRFTSAETICWSEEHSELKWIGEF
jgi:hypothetical protein